MSEARPIRLRLSRAKGFNLQAASIAANGLPAVKVARPSKWGNPWKIAKAREIGFTGDDKELAQMACNCFARSLTVKLPATAKINDRLHELRGKNLACFCALDAPCHGDVLLEFANRPDEAPPHD